MVSSLQLLKRSSLDVVEKRQELNLRIAHPARSNRKNRLRATKGEMGGGGVGLNNLSLTLLHLIRSFAPTLPLLLAALTAYLGSDETLDRLGPPKRSFQNDSRKPLIPDSLLSTSAPYPE